MLDIQIDRNHIDHGMAAALTQQGQNFLCFIGTDKVVRQNPLHILNTLLDHLWVVSAAILT